MSAAVVFQWHTAALNQLLRGPQGDVARDLTKRAYRIRGGAIRRCPVGTPESTHKPGYHGGRLRGSIHVSLGVDGGGVFALIGAYTEYAIFVHEGTYKMAARPFIMDAIHD